MFLKVYLKLKQITKNGSCSYCDGEIKERFVNIVPFLPQMTISGLLSTGLSHSFNRLSIINKYMIALPQITNTSIFTFIAVLVFKLLSRKVLFINRKNNKNLKSRLLFKTIAISRVNYCKIIHSWNEKFSGYFETRKRSLISAFLICSTFSFNCSSLSLISLLSVF